MLSPSPPHLPPIAVPEVQLSQLRRLLWQTVCLDFDGWPKLPANINPLCRPRPSFVRGLAGPGYGRPENRPTVGDWCQPWLRKGLANMHAEVLRRNCRLGPSLRDRKGQPAD